jgi:hypothetical protein
VIAQFRAAPLHAPDEAKYRSRKMHPTVPVIVALIVAVVGQAVILFGDFRPNNHPNGGGMVTAAALTRAGAIEVPAGP